MPVTYSPVAIDPSEPNGELSGQIAGATQGPFIYANQVYIVIEDIDSLTTGVFKSPDGGASWSELDAANRVPALGTPYFDGASTIIVAYHVTGGGAQPIRLRNFNLATGLWGATYGTTGAPTTPGNIHISTVYQRPDGTIVVFYAANGNGRLLTASVYDPIGDTWGVAIDMSANIEALPGWDALQTNINTAQIRSAMDSTGRIHVFIGTLSNQIVPVIWGNRVFCQALEANDTLGSFFDFPGQSTAIALHQDLEAFAGPPFGQPALLGDTILLPVSVYNRNVAPFNFPHDYPCLYIGTGLATPVWAVDTSLSIDPEVFVDDTIWWQESPSMWTDGISVVAIGPAQTSPAFTNFGRLRLSITTDLVTPANGWAATTIFDTDIDPTFGTALNIASVRITNFQIQVSVDIFDGTNEARFWMGNWSVVQQFLGYKSGGGGGTFCPPPGCKLPLKVAEAYQRSLRPQRVNARAVMAYRLALRGLS